MKIITGGKELNRSDHKIMESILTSQQYTFSNSPPNPINVIFIDCQYNSFRQKRISTDETQGTCTELPL